MLEAALLRHDGIPGHVLHLALDGLAVEVGQLHSSGSHHGEVAIGKKKDVSRVIQNGGNIRGHKIFSIAQADHERRTVARSYDLIRFIDRDNSQGKDSGELLYCLTDSVLKGGMVAVAGLEKMFFNQVGDD